VGRIIVVGGGQHLRISLALALLGSKMQVDSVPERIVEFPGVADGKNLLRRGGFREYGSPRSRAGRAARWG